MNMTNTLLKQTIQPILLLTLLSFSACHSSSINDNGKPPSDDDLTPVLRESNWRLVVGEVFDVFTQSIYNDQLIQTDHTVLPGRSYQFPFQNSNYAMYSENDCTDGGVVTSRSSPSSCDGRCRTRTTMYYACSSLGHSLLGRVYKDTGFSSSTIQYDALALTSSAGQQSHIKGTLGSASLGSKLSNNLQRSATLSRYESTNDAGTIVLIDVDTVFSYGTDQAARTASAELKGSLLLRSPNTGDASVSASVTEPFINEESEKRQFARGTLKLQAEDGSRIELTANNGDTQTFDVILKNNVVSTIKFSERWDDWAEQLSFN